MNAPSPHHRRSAEDHGDHNSRGDAALVYDQGRRDHQRDHSDFEEDASAKTGFAKRGDHEDQNSQGNGDKCQAEVARPEFAHAHVEQSASRLIWFVRHEERPPRNRRPADGRNYSNENARAKDKAFQFGAGSTKLG